MNLGEAIKRLRSKSGMTQGELAGRADLTQSYLSQVEGNKKKPTLDTLQRISKGIDVPLPVVFFLSTDSSDLSSVDRELYDEIEPQMRFLIDRYFPENESA